MSLTDIDRDEFLAVLAEATPEETEAILAGLEVELAESGWEGWARVLFPGYCTHPFAEHHGELWRWLWSIEAGVRPHPFVAIWPRGGAKSTSGEMGAVALGARAVRRYGLYICETQDQADDHVGNIGSMLESAAVERIYPDLAARMVGKYGNSKGWRRNRLRTAAGFTIDAVGLDTASRGVKLDEDRPDFMVIDDVDDQHDSPKVTDTKIETLTRALLPAGSDDLAVLAIQNLVHPGSVFAQLADGRAEFLADRMVSGPVPAVVGLATERHGGRVVVAAGVPTWAGQDLVRCQDMLDDIGETAFRSECQHEVTDPPGGMFDHLDFRHCRAEEVPDLVRVEVWCDPAVTNTDQSDSMGVQADGLAPDGTIYRLFSWEKRDTPTAALELAIATALDHGASVVGVETDQGGDTWESVYREAGAAVCAERGLTMFDLPRFASAKAGSTGQSKTERAQKMLVAYERGWFVHVLGTHGVLEGALRRFPKKKPYDLTDAAYWAAVSLRPEMGERAVARIGVAGARRRPGRLAVGAS